MFTGLIQTKGTIERREVSGAEGVLTVRPAMAFAAPVMGESVAVNGACLTLAAAEGGLLRFNVLAETFRRTNLGLLTLGAEVNLERALAFGDRLGGHLVQGHVDGVGEVAAWTRLGRDWELKVKFPPEHRKHFINKGSVALDGVSLTIVALDSDSLSVNLIPTTYADTCLAARGRGAPVNIETDMIGKYVFGFLSNLEPAKSKVTMDTLRQAGWEL